MTVKTNDQVIIEEIINKEVSNFGGEIDKSDYFELFSSAEILKNYDLTYDEIEYGNVGSGGDGGVDSFYFFLNGELIKEDTEINLKQKKNLIEIHVIQSKLSNGFKEDVILKFKRTSEDLFNLSKDISVEFSSKYNTKLLNLVSNFTDTYQKLSINFPDLKIIFHYASIGNEVHPNVEKEVVDLKNSVLRMFNGAKFDFKFVGATELLAMKRDMPSRHRQLKIAESPISSESGSYICLVNLSDYFEFICDNGTISKSIFESNVRDYQGSVIVNEGIKKTLKNKESENFWYLNNGVTIITPKATASGKILTMEDPQIVNGLQTSHEVYEFFASQDKIKDDTREILVRVICESDTGARDRIISATNSQTSIPPASLRSSDEVHRNIEDYLLSRGYYYDRRKNYYKNEGKPASKVISIPYLAQAMMSLVLLRPDTARARPSTLLNNQSDYSKIFNLDMKILTYYNSLYIAKSVDFFFKKGSEDGTVIAKDSTNIKWYVVMVVGMLLAKSTDSTVILKDIEQSELSDLQIKEAHDFVAKKYQELGKGDKLAKGSGLLKAILEEEFLKSL